MTGSGDVEGVERRLADTCVVVCHLSDDVRCEEGVGTSLTIVLLFTRPASCPLHQ